MDAGLLEKAEEGLGLMAKPPKPNRYQQLAIETLHERREHAPLARPANHDRNRFQRTLMTVEPDRRLELEEVMAFAHTATLALAGNPDLLRRGHRKIEPGVIVGALRRDDDESAAASARAGQSSKNRLS